MAGYLENYRAGEEARHRVIKWLVLAGFALLIAAIVLYFMFRDYREQQKISGFLDALRQHNYAAAYQFWGCSMDKPCHDYDYARFMEDWGPQSKHTRLDQAKLVQKKSCSTGIIQMMDFSGESVNLWVDRKTQVVGFAPWPVCNPRMQVPVGGN